MEKTRKPGFLLAISPIVFMLAVLIIGITVLDISIEILLIVSTAFTALIAIYLGHTWQEIENELCTKLATAFPAISILLVVGIMIGAWIVSGTIPYLLYIGLSIISPKFIVVTAFLVTVILSVSTGTSWGAAGTAGVALMGCAAGMGASLPAVAGAVVAGAYFGDKMSPFSDSTNLSAIAAGTSLYKHIGHMLYTTVPGFIICCIVYTVAGIHFAGGSTGSTGNIDAILSALTSLYHMSMPVGLLLLIPPAIVIVGALTKKPTIPIMIISSAFATLIGIFVQGFSIRNCALSMISGFEMSMFENTSVDIDNIIADVPRLLERGGASSMMGTVLIAFCGFAFVSALHVSGCLDVALPRLMSKVRTTGQLILTTVLSGVLMITTTGNASVSFLTLGGLYHDEYIKRGLEAKNLSRTFEDSITVVEPLIPWTLAGVYMTSTLGVSPLQYGPWACLCYTGVIFAVIYGFTGFGIAKIKKDGDNYDEYVQLTGKEL
ncbi:MAG: Na+/H+ antiporter NhaC [Eubacteriales bacterium]|nr:Na+/H+ antiporter NhaC [Eubacteriales bacterium]